MGRLLIRFGSRNRAWPRARSPSQRRPRSMPPRTVSARSGPGTINAGRWAARRSPYMDTTPGSVPRISKFGQRLARRSPKRLRKASSKSPIAGAACLFACGLWRGVGMRLAAGGHIQAAYNVLADVGTAEEAHDEMMPTTTESRAAAERSRRPGALSAAGRVFVWAEEGTPDRSNAGPTYSFRSPTRSHQQAFDRPSSRQARERALGCRLRPRR